MIRRITLLAAITAVAIVATLRRRGAEAPAPVDHEVAALERLDAAIAYAESQHPSPEPVDGPHGPGCTCSTATAPDGVSLEAAAYDQVVAVRAEIDRHLEAGRRVLVPMPFASEADGVKIEFIPIARHPERN